MNDDDEIEVRDPVCARLLGLGEVTVMLEHGGWAYFFCSTGCREAFRQDPDGYAAAAPPDRAEGRRKPGARSIALPGKTTPSQGD